MHIFLVVAHSSFYFIFKNVTCELRTQSVLQDLGLAGKKKNTTWMLFFRAPILERVTIMSMQSSTITGQKVSRDWESYFTGTLLQGNAF